MLAPGVLAGYPLAPCPTRSMWSSPFRSWATMSCVPPQPASHITWAPYVLDGAALDPGLGERQVLMHIGIGDAQVPSLAGHIHARSMGLPILRPGVSLSTRKIVSSFSWPTRAKTV